MSDKPESGPVKPEKELTPKPKVKRVSNKRPKKSDSENASNISKDAVVEKPESSLGASENEGRRAFEDGNDSSEPQKKRSTRRRRGKGKSSPRDQQEDMQEESSAESRSSEETSEKTHSNQPNPQKPRRKADPEKVASKAWKIFLAEVSEEGVALIADNDARELSRRCFRLAELFIEEQQRRN